MVGRVRFKDRRGVDPPITNSHRDLCFTSVTGDWSLRIINKFMPTLILLLVVGSLITYLSKFNFMLVSLSFGKYVFTDIPLFYVIIGSLLVGLVLSYIAFLITRISSSFKMRGKDIEIKKNIDEVLELTKRVHQLELENEKLKHEPTNEPEDKNAL